MTDLPTQAGRRKRRRTGRAALIAVAITTAVAGAAAVSYAVGWGFADDSRPPAAPVASVDVAKQMECTSIKREYDSWLKAKPLEDLERFRGEFTATATKDAVSEGQALAKATTGYADEPALALAAAVSRYNVEIAFLNIQAAATNDYEDASFAKAMAAYGDVNVRFNEFWAKTCS